MADFKNLKISTKGDVIIITIDRVEKLNSLNHMTLKELAAAIQGVYDDKEIRGAIIIGEGDKAFVAGADITEIAELSEVNGRKYSESGQETFALIEDCHKPIIAAVNGFALGGGCELAMACHIRVATENAKFGLPEVKIGIMPGFGGTQRLTQLIGKSKALELMMTADFISAQEAKELGLVNHVVGSKQDLIAKCEEILGKIAANAPLAIGMVVNCVNAAFNEDENGYQTEANSFSNCCKSSDFKEGTSAFLEKRKPNFVGE